MNSELSSPTLLLIGECSSAQFSRVLTERSSSDTLNPIEKRSVRLIEEALPLLSAGEFVPDVVVCYQSIPDEYLPAEIEKLIGMLPFSRFVVVFSPWCESIGRTEQHWPAAWSVPLAHAPARIHQELQRCMTGQPPLQATASRDEAFATLAASCLKDSSETGNGITVHIESEDQAVLSCLSDLMTSLGFQRNEGSNPDVLLIAAAFIGEQHIQRVHDSWDQNAASSRSDNQVRSKQIIVACDLVTPAQERALQQAGATAVISQLRFTEEIVRCFRKRNVLQSSIPSAPREANRVPDEARASAR